MDSAAEQIKMAMANSLSLNEQLRNEAQDFLTKQCEPVPQYQQVLLYIIASYSRQTAQSTQNDQMMQYQAILFMKNSLTRLLQMHRNLKRYTRGQSTALPPAAEGKAKQTTQPNQGLQVTLQNLSGFPAAVNQ